MKALALSKWICAASAVLCAAALAAALVCRFSYWGYCTVFALMVGALAAALFVTARKKLMVMKKIVENAIICIQPADIGAPAEETDALRDKLVMYVSCFGILLGTTVIEFNPNGNKLKTVEIGKDYIRFVCEIFADPYGLKKENQSVRLLYARPNGRELANIVEKFRRETGIIPTIAG